MNRRTFLSLVALSTAGVGRARSAEPVRLKHVATIPLPGVKGRFDHFACDPAGKRLIVAALGNDTGEVLDVGRNARLHTIPGLQKPTGALILPQTNRLYFANGNSGKLRCFDSETFAEASMLEGLDDADNVRFDPAARHIYIGYGDGALAVTDESAKQLLQRIPLPAHPESFQLELRGPRIFINVPDKKQVAVVDRKQGKVIATWPMEKWQANFPMALDESRQRLFIGCRNPSRLIALDTRNGSIVADVEISGDTDDLFIDPKRERVYVSCGEGFIDVVQMGPGDQLHRSGRIATRGGARTSYFSPELDRLFVAVPERNEAPAELRVYAP